MSKKSLYFFLILELVLSWKTKTTLWAAPKPIQLGNESTNARLIQEIEDRFWEKRKQSCGRAALCEGGKVLGFWAVNLGLLLGAQKVLRAYFSTESFPKEKVEDLMHSQTQRLGPAEQSALTQLSAAATGTASVGITGLLGTFLLNAWKHFGTTSLNRVVFNVRYTKLAQALANSRFSNSYAPLFTASKVLDELELKYEILKGLSSENENANEADLIGFESLISLLKMELNRIAKIFGPYSGSRDNQHQSLLTPVVLSRIEAVLDLPIEAKQFNANQMKGVFSNLEKYFQETFDPNVAMFFQAQASRIFENSQLPLDSNFKDRTNIYLVGPPGTGKTATAEAFAKALGLPFCKIEGSSLTPAQLTGVHDLKEPKSPGKILSCFSAKNSSDSRSYSNLVIFIDEADHLVNSELYGQQFEQLFKTMLENKFFRDEALQITFDLSQVIFIFSGNGPFQSWKSQSRFHSQALLQRFHTIAFPSINCEQRQKIAVDQFLKQIAEIRKYSPSQEDYTYVLNVLTPYDHKQSEGVRVLREVINQFVIHRKSGLTISEFDYQQRFSQVTFHGGKISKLSTAAENFLLKDGQVDVATQTGSELQTIEEQNLALKEHAIDSIINGLKFLMQPSM